MESPEEIEKALHRLAPVEFSERGQRALDGIIDGLSTAATLAPVPLRPAPRSAWWTAAVAVPTAAAAALAVALFMTRGGNSHGPEGVAQATSAEQGSSGQSLTGAPVATLRKVPVSDPDLPGDMPAYNLFVRERVGKVSLPMGQIMVTMKADGDVFRLTTAGDEKVYEGALEDQGFPGKWKPAAKGLQRALHSAVEKDPGRIE